MSAFTLKCGPEILKLLFFTTYAKLYLQHYRIYYHLTLVTVSSNPPWITHTEDPLSVLLAASMYTTKVVTTMTLRYLIWSSITSKCLWITFDSFQFQGNLTFQYYLNISKSHKMHQTMILMNVLFFTVVIIIVNALEILICYENTILKEIWQLALLLLRWRNHEPRGRRSMQHTLVPASRSSIRLNLMQVCCSWRYWTQI